MFVPIFLPKVSIPYPPPRLVNCCGAGIYEGNIGKRFHTYVCICTVITSLSLVNQPRQNEKSISKLKIVWVRVQQHKCIFS